jgi:hypothetical protein
MEATDAAELISEIREERAEAAAEERFRSAAALLIAVMAMLLAIGSLGGGNVAEDMVHANIRVNDTWAFFQAKNMRQTVYRVALDDMERRLAVGAPAAEEALLRESADRYRETIARYDDEPDPAAPGDSLRGEGKKQLAAQARALEEVRERAGRQDANFDLSEVAFQLAIVLGSVAILSMSRLVLGLSVGLGVAGLVLLVNGFFLLFHLPF